MFLRFLKHLEGNHYVYQYQLDNSGNRCNTTELSETYRLHVNNPTIDMHQEG